MSLKNWRKRHTLSASIRMTSDWYRIIADSVCHDPPNYQRYFNPFNENFRFFSDKYFFSSHLILHVLLNPKIINEIRK